MVCFEILRGKFCRPVAVEAEGIAHAHRLSAVKSGTVTAVDS